MQDTSMIKALWTPNCKLRPNLISAQSVVHRLLIRSSPLCNGKWGRVHCHRLIKPSSRLDIPVKLND